MQATTADTVQGPATHGVRAARDAHVNVVLLARRHLDSMEELCRAAGITHQQYVVLWTLCLTDGADAGLPICSLADGLLHRASDTTRLVDRLAGAGLVERLPNPTDRRSVLVRATASGRRAFAEVTPTLEAFHRSQWSGLEPAELGQLNRLLAKALWSVDA